MESTPGSRLAEWREFKGITLAEMARLTGISKTTINTVEQVGSSNPSYDTITKVLAGFPDLNPDWLLLGIGPMVRGGRSFAPAPFAQPAPAPATPAPFLAAEPAAAYGCIAPDQVASLTLEVSELRAENKTLQAELRQARKEAREDLLAQARTYNSVKDGQSELITRLYAKIDEYELRLGYRQPTAAERQQQEQAGSGAPRLEMIPFGARYREATASEPQAAADEDGGKVLQLYPVAELSYCEAA